MRLGTRLFVLLAPVLMWFALMSPATANAEPEFCWKDSYPRGAGSVPDSCAPGLERIGLLCYEACPAGTARFGFDCHSVCPDGMDDQGLLCRQSEYGRGAGFAWWFSDGFSDAGMFARCEQAHGRGRCEKHGAIVYPKCKPGYEPFGCCLCRPEKAPDCNALGLAPGVDLSCAKKVTVVAPETGTCDPDEDEDAGLCYETCKDGYNGVGPVCWADTPDAWVECGMGAAKNDVTCRDVVISQVSSVGQIAMFVGTLGTSSAGSAAAGGVRGGTQLAKLKQQFAKLKQAWKTIEDAPQTRAAFDAADAADLGFTAPGIANDLENASTEEDMARVSAQIAALLDPTGVSASVGSYTYPTCSKYF